MHPPYHPLSRSHAPSLAPPLQLSKVFRSVLLQRPINDLHSILLDMSQALDIHHADVAAGRRHPFSSVFFWHRKGLVLGPVYPLGAQPASAALGALWIGRQWRASAAIPLPKLPAFPPRLPLLACPPAAEADVAALRQCQDWLQNAITFVMEVRAGPRIFVMPT